MPINPLKGGDKVLRIESHNGFLDGPLASKIKYKKDKSSSWNFYRENSNHAYLSGGKIEYSGNCENNLIISSRGKNSLKNINNSFIISNNQGIEIFSISDFKKIKKFILENLLGRINYNVPLKVRQREELFSYDSDSVGSILKNFYGINSKIIFPILSGRIKEGKYFVKDVDEKRYVFKYRGNDKKEVELNSKIISKSSSFFPKFHQRIDDFSYGVVLQDGCYGLEDFVKGEPVKKRNLKHMKKIGKTMAALHNNLDFFLKSNSKLNFIPGSENFSESNMFSLYLDLFNKTPETTHLIPFVEEIISWDLSSRMRKIPKRIIHGDLNSSNVIDSGEKLIIIDSETLEQDVRLKEFISPLLLGGNMTPPKYLGGSLPILINQYNQYSKFPLSQEETSILPLLLQASILKYHVIREIRRDNKIKNSIQNTIENIEKIREDSNAH